MDDQTVRVIVKINFLVLAFVVTMMVISGMKKSGLSEGFRSLMGFESPAQSQQTIRAGQ